MLWGLVIKGNICRPEMYHGVIVGGDRLDNDVGLVDPPIDSAILFDTVHSEAGLLHVLEHTRAHSGPGVAHSLTRPVQ